MSTAENVLRFPTKRKRPYPQPPEWWRREMPANVRKIRQPKPPTQGPTTASPVALMVLALIDALDAGGPEDLIWSKVCSVLGKRARLYDDEQAQASALVALEMMFARRTGRY